jgi:hypothetical protein
MWSLFLWETIHFQTNPNSPPPHGNSVVQLVPCPYESVRLVPCNFTRVFLKFSAQSRTTYVKFPTFKNVWKWIRGTCLYLWSKLSQPTFFSIHYFKAFSKIMITGQLVVERTKSPTFGWRKTNKGRFSIYIYRCIFHFFSVWYNFCNYFPSKTTWWNDRGHRWSADRILRNTILQAFLFGPIHTEEPGEYHYSLPWISYFIKACCTKR